MAPMGPFCKPRVFTRGYDFVWEDLLRETLSVKALRLCQIPPFVTYGDIFPRCGGSLPSQGELLRISYGQR